MSNNFALNVSTPYQNVIQSLNYALANLNGTTGNANVVIGGNVVQVNANTGQIYANVGTISYLYGYVDIAYANSATGGGFTSNSTNAQYYGIHNTNSPVWDSNPTDYQWTQVAGGFGTTNGLYYSTLGGGSINFFVGNTAPQYYQPVIDATPIALVDITANAVSTTSIVDGAITNVQIASNTVTGNNIQLNTITGNLIQANTIQGNSIVAGSITATQLEANLLVVGNITSFGSTIETPTGPGYWLDYTNGNVYFGGNTRVGNNLIVGNNASIGGNVAITGLVSAGSLEANTVVTTNMFPFSVSTSIFSSTSLTQTYTNIVSGTPYYYSDQSTSITTTLPNQQVYINATAAYDLSAGGTGYAQPVLGAKIVMLHGGVYTPLINLLNIPVLLSSSSGGGTTWNGSINLTAATTIPFSGNTYSFFIELDYGTPTLPSGSSLSFTSGTVLIQNLYR